MRIKFELNNLVNDTKGVFTLVVQFSWFFWSRPKKKIMHLVLFHTVIFMTEPKDTKQKKVFMLRAELNTFVVCAYI